MKKKKLRLVKKLPIVAANELQLPKQGRDDIQLLDTDTKLLLELAKPNIFRDEIKKAKLEFIAKIEQTSKVCNLSADVRIYFTFTDTGKKE